MGTYKKGLLIFCGFSLAVNLLLGVVPIAWAKHPRAATHGLVYLLADAVAMLLVIWVLRKDLNWLSSTLAAVGIVLLAFLLTTASDFVFPH